MEEKLIVVLITFPSADVAKSIGKELLQQRLCACVTLTPPVTSLYYWEHTWVEQVETLALIKTTAEKFEELKQAVLGLHPYETPEIIALPIEHGNVDYLNWIKSSVSIS